MPVQSLTDFVPSCTERRVDCEGRCMSGMEVLGKRRRGESRRFRAFITKGTRELGYGEKEYNDMDDWRKEVLLWRP